MIHTMGVAPVAGKAAGATFYFPIMSGLRMVCYQLLSGV